MQLFSPVVMICFGAILFTKNVTKSYIPLVNMGNFLSQSFSLAILMNTMP